MAKRPSIRRAGWWVTLGLAAAWTLAWLGAPALAPPAAPACQPVAGWARGVYHVHAIAHDGRDRSAALLAAARAACLDFIIVTEHEGASSEVAEGAASAGGVVAGGGPLVLVGAERRGATGHHLGELGTGGALRVLNHPWDSGVTSLTQLTAHERALAATGALGVEVLNAWRLVKRASPGALALAWLVGPARLDLAQAALSLPGEDVALWVALQAEGGARAPMLCGSDAHGDLVPYPQALSTLVLWVPVPPGAALDAPAIEAALHAGRALCVNEALGSPGPLSVEAACVAGAGCALRVEAALPADARWEVVRGADQVVAEGRGAARVPMAQPGVYHVRLWRRVDLGWPGRVERLWALAPGGVRVGMTERAPRHDGR